MVCLVVLAGRGTGIRLEEVCAAHRTKVPRHARRRVADEARRQALRRAGVKEVLLDDSVETHKIVGKHAGRQPAVVAMAHSAGKRMHQGSG